MGSLEKQRLVAFISGSGTTMEQIYKATKNGTLCRTELVGVIATESKKAEVGIKRALDLGIPPEHIGVIPKETYSAETILDALTKLNPDLIGLFGFLKKIPSEVIAQYPDQMINQHPGPIDPSPHDFGGDRMIGLRVHATRLMFVQETQRNFWTDVTSQRVAPELDKGRVLNRCRVSILHSDTPFSLQQRVLPFEWRAQIETIKMFEDGDLKNQPTYQELGINLVLPSEYQLLDEIKKEVINTVKI